MYHLVYSTPILPYPTPILPFHFISFTPRSYSVLSPNSLLLSRRPAPMLTCSTKTSPIGTAFPSLFSTSFSLFLHVFSSSLQQIKSESPRSNSIRSIHKAGSAEDTRTGQYTNRCIRVRVNLTLTRHPFQSYNLVLRSPSFLSFLFQFIYYLFILFVG